MQTARASTLASALAIALVVQAPADPLLDRLAGRWQGSGTVLGQAATIEAEWAWALDQQFLALSFRNEMLGSGGTRRFEGRAYYRAVGTGRYRGFWIDNSGAIRPIDARAEGDALVAAWGTDDTERGETTYRLASPDRLEITDRVRQRDGTWRDFGQSVLMKR
jgi:hypothetical protein